MEEKSEPTPKQTENDYPTRRALEEKIDETRAGYKTKHGAGSPYQKPTKDWSADEHPTQKPTTQD